MNSLKISRHIWLFRCLSLLLFLVALSDLTTISWGRSSLCPICDGELFECRENAGERLEHANRICNSSSSYAEFQTCHEHSLEEDRRRRSACSDQWWFCTECLCSF
jgi:hypothetical protein